MYAKSAEYNETELKPKANLSRTCEKKEANWQKYFLPVYIQRSVDSASIKSIQQCIIVSRSIRIAISVKQ